MAYSKRSRRSSRSTSSTNSLLRRLVEKMAPTQGMMVRRIKQASRGLETQRTFFNDGIEQAFPAKFTAEQKSKLFGRGGYWGNRIGGAIGSLVGNRTFGASLGSAMGDAAASVIPYGNEIAAGAQHLAQISGMGSYNMGGNTEAMQVGTFASGDVDRINIKSREYLGAVKGSVAYQLKSLLLNPGNTAAFPQLSRLAMHYQQYQFNGLVFWYHSTSGESTNTADTAIGEVLMGNQPDSTESDPVNKQQFCGLDGAKQAKPSLDQVHGIECAPGYSVIKYVRHGDLIEASQDAARFDLGKFHMAVEGCNAITTRIGELWVSYDIDLIRARDSKGAEVYSSCVHCPVATDVDLFTTQGVRYNNLNITFGTAATGTPNQLIFPDFINDGDYQIDISLLGTEIVGNTFAANTPTITVNANATVVQQFQSGGRNTVGAANDYSSVTCLGSYVIRIKQDLTAGTTSNAIVQFNNVITVPPAAPRTAIWPSAYPGLASGYLICAVSRIPFRKYGA